MKKLNVKRTLFTSLLVLLLLVLALLNAFAQVQTESNVYSNMHAQQ